MDDFLKGFEGSPGLGERETVPTDDAFLKGFDGEAGTIDLPVNRLHCFAECSKIP